MNKTVKKDVIEFYKALKLKIIVEDNRQYTFKQELISIEGSLDTERLLTKRVQVEQQEHYLITLKAQEKDLANQLLGYANTMNDTEAFVFSMGIMQNRPLKDIAKKSGMSYGFIRNIKARLDRELNSMIVVKQL